MIHRVRKGIPLDTDGALLIGQEWRYRVQSGQIPGYSIVDKFGYNSEITSSTDPEDIWEGGGTYPYSTTSNIDTLSSSDTGDTTQLIKIQGIIDPSTSTGIDTGWSGLNGQNKVLIYDNSSLTGDPISFWRVWRMENEADAGNNLSGICYCYVDTPISAGAPIDTTKTRAIINNGNNQTLMAMITIPPKKVGFLFKGEIGMIFSGSIGAGTQFLNGIYQSRRYGKLFKIKKLISAINSGNSNYFDARSFPDPIPALTDIKLTSYEVSDTMGAWGTFDIMLVDEEMLSTGYLAAIGQPGY